MADIERQLKMIKSMLRSTLISSKEGIPARTLLRDYENLTQEPLSFKSLGFSSLEEFIQSIPDVVEVRRNAAGEIILHAVADESNKHILKLVSKQKMKKTRKLSAPRKLSPMTKRTQSKWESKKPVPWHATNRQPLLELPQVPPPRKSVFERLGPRPKVQEHSYAGVSKPAHVPYQNITDFQIEVARTPSGRGHGRRVNIGGSRRMFNAAMLDVANERKSKFARAYEVPPRFRRDQVQMHSSASDSDGASGDDGQQGKKYVYIDMYRAYCKKNNLPPADFNTYSIKGSGFVSVITLYGETYGSGEFFPTAKEAEDDAAKSAVQELELDKKDVAQGQSVSSKEESNFSTEDLLEIKKRIKQIITGKMNGLWASRLPFEYKEKFGEEPPACLMDLIKNSFKDICKVELAQYTERELVYPVLEDHDKCKELRILQQELLPIGEKITVYLTYIYNCGYFCVQKEDSCIDQIAEELQKDCKTKSTPDMEQLKTGQFCAGLFSADKCWTRAKIIDIKDSEPKIELLFVDYGDVERVLSKDIRWLSEKTAAAPAQCIKCSLHGIQPLETETRWSSASAEAFAKIVKDVPLIAVTRTHYDDTCDVDLCLVSDPAINISDKLIQQGVVRSLFPVESYLEESDEEEDEEELEEEEEEEEEDVEEEEEEDASCPDPITLPDEKTWDVHITFINDSTNSVMMRFVGESYSDQLDLFESLLEQEFKKQKSEPVTEGMICVAHDDELYHRVHVESIMNKKVVCFFLDHGDTNVLTMEQLRPLDAAINKKLPYQAVPVSLYGLEEVAENMTVLSKLCELALGKTCVAEPVNRNDSFSVILYDTTGDSDININEEILRVVGKEERDVTAAIGDLSLVDIAAKLSTETVMNQQKDSSEKDVSKELGSDVSKGGSKTASPKQKVDRPVSATHGITSTAETVLASGKIDSVEKDTSQITNSCKSSLGAENRLENTSHSFTNNTEQLTAVDVESTRMEPVLSLSSTSKQKLLPSGSSSVKSLSSEDESHDLDVRTIWNPKEYAKRPLPPKVVIPDEGSYIDLHVIQADSPSNFVCIPYEQMDQLNQLFEDMLEYFTPPPQLIIKEDEITLNHLYAGNVSGVWHRVKVQQFVDRLLSVYLVDMGRYSVVSLEELQPLPWKFWKIPMQAFTARLGGIKPLGGSWSEGAKLKFTELAFDKDLVGLVISNKIEDGAVSLRLVDTSQENLDICVDEILLTKQFAVIA